MDNLVIDSNTITMAIMALISLAGVIMVVGRSLGLNESVKVHLLLPFFYNAALYSWALFHEIQGEPTASLRLLFRFATLLLALAMVLELVIEYRQWRADQKLINGT